MPRHFPPEYDHVTVPLTLAGHSPAAITGELLVAVSMTADRTVKQNVAKSETHFLARALDMTTPHSEIEVLKIV